MGERRFSQMDPAIHLGLCLGATVPAWISLAWILARFPLLPAPLLAQWPPLDSASTLMTLLFALALAHLRKEDTRPRARILGGATLGLALLAAVAGSLPLAWIRNLQAPIPSILFFGSASLALLCLDCPGPWMRRLGRAMGLSAFLLGLLLLTALNLGETALFRFGPAPALSPLAAVLDPLLGILLLLGIPDPHWIWILDDEDGKALQIRRLLPFAAGIPLLLGGLALLLRGGLGVPAATGATLATVASIVLLGGLVLWATRSGRRLDERRRKAEESLACTLDTLLRENQELRRTEEALRQATAEMERVNRDLEAFAQSISHDLKAPLRHIAGFASLLERNAAARLPEADRHHLKVIADSAQRLLSLTDRLLSFTRTDRSPLKRERVALNPLLDRVREELEPECQGRDIQWEIGDLPEVEADGALLGLVFQNLLSNAVKYTRGRQPAHIQVKAHRTGDMVECSVADNGTGFDMRYVSRIFGIFQRLHRQDEFEGMGIGLATAARIIRRHGGTIRAEGDPGQGAAFHFTLPA